MIYIMALIRPCADLRNNYNEISRICHQTMQPIYITKNGYNDLVILSNEAYEKYEEEQIDKLIQERFEKKYANFEEFKKDICEKIDLALEDIREGRTTSAKDFFKEMEAKYNF